MVSLANAEDLLNASSKSDIVHISKKHWQMIGIFECDRVKHHLLQRIARLGTLASPECLSDYNIDELVRLMIQIRQHRLGIGPQQVKDGKGNVICECKVPKLYVNADEYEIDIDEERKKLALCAVTL